MFDALYQAKGSIRVIHTRHEQGTAYMAFGYAQSTGKVGTHLVVPGPGLLNASAGLSTAFACGAKVLCLAGQIPSKLIGKGIGQLHELSDHPGAVASVTKWRGRAESPATVPEKVREAFKQLNTGRTQPVLLEMSPDIMASEGEVDLLDPIVDFVDLDPEPDPDLIEQAAALLGNAENPGIFIGGGIWGGEESLLSLAEQIQAPVYTSPHGNGAINDRHYLAQNLMCAKEIWDQIDVVLSVGTRYQAPASWGKQDEKKLFEKSNKFLWTVRFHLHYLASRKEDRLTFDQQAPVADLMQFGSRRNATGAERFMKYYYRVAKDVGNLTRTFCSALEVEHRNATRKTGFKSFRKYSVVLGLSLIHI